MNRRALLLSLVTGSMLWTQGARARTPEGTHRLGAFFASSREWAQSKNGGQRFVKALAERGYVEGRNLAVEWRLFGMDFARGAQMAAELVRLKVDVLVTMGTPQTKALGDATSTIPIVTSVQDPVASGFTESLAQPRGNIIGLSQTHPDTPGKQVELFKVVVPKLRRLVFVGDVRYGGVRHLLRANEVAARAAGLAAEVKIVAPSELGHVFSEMRPSAVQGAFLVFANFDGVDAAGLAIRHGVATMFAVEQGGLMSFEMRHANLLQRTASMIDKVLRGVKPASLAWELPDESRFAINLRTAKALGLAVPAHVLLRADQVVE